MVDEQTDKWVTDMDIFWNSKHWYKGREYRLTKDESKNLPPHFSRASRSGCLADRLKTLDRQLTHLRNRRHRLVGMQLSSGGASLVEANEVSREISKLELKRGELTGR